MLFNNKNILVLSVLIIKFKKKRLDFSYVIFIEI